MLTDIGPVLAPAGSTAFSVVGETNVTLVAGTPWKLTLELGVKPTPLIVIIVPAAARPGDSPVTDSVGVYLTVLTPVLTAVVTEIVAAIAPLGTVASIRVGESTVKVAESEPKRTRLAPVNALPLIVTVLPVMPDAGESEVIAGTFEAIAPLGAEETGVPPPEALLARTMTRTV